MKNERSVSLFYFIQCNLQCNSKHKKIETQNLPYINEKLKDKVNTAFSTVTDPKWTTSSSNPFRNRCRYPPAEE